MKLIIRAITMLVVIVGVMSYGAYLTTGKLPWQSLTLPKNPNLLKSKQPMKPAKKAKKDLVYKWRDAHGVWQFSEEPPTDDLAYDQLEVDPNASVINLSPIAQEKEGHTKAAGDKAEGSKESVTAFPFAPERIQKLTDDAREVQEKLNKRAQSQQKLLEDL